MGGRTPPPAQCFDFFLGGGGASLHGLPHVLGIVLGCRAGGAAAQRCSPRLSACPATTAGRSRRQLEHRGKTQLRRVDSRLDGVTCRVL